MSVADTKIITRQVVWTKYCNVTFEHAILKNVLILDLKFQLSTTF